MSRVIIDNIKPFNDIYYRSCIYNSLFSVVNYFNSSVIPYLANDITSYGTISSQYGSLFGCEYYSKKTIEQLLEENDIIHEIYDFDNEEKLWDKIVESVSKGKLIIIWLDSYEIAFRSDVYHKMHSPHSWVIYGYEEDSKEVYIFEQSESEVLDYSPRMASLEVLSNAHFAFNKIFRNMIRNTMYVLSNSNEVYKKSSVINEKEAYIKYFNENYEFMQRGLKNLTTFGTQLQHIVGKESILCDQKEQLCYLLNQLINDKKAELYKWTLLKDDKKALLMKEIVHAWDKIRIPIVKYSLTNLYKSEKFNNIIYQINEIVDLETEYINCILDNL